MVDKHQTTSTQAIRRYRDLTDWYPLLTPVGDYAEEAAYYRRLFEPLVLPFEHSASSNAGHEVFLGLRPAANGGA